MTTPTDSSTRKFASTPSCHMYGDGTSAEEGTPVVAVVDAPNSGKSTLFNSLADAKTQMGNQSGTTMEISRDAQKADVAGYDVIDFPGAYPLDTMNPGEELTRETLIEKPEEECPDLIVVVVDAAALGRGLYMATELAEQSQHIVLILTKLDAAKAKGIDVNPDALKPAIGTPVVALDPRRKAGMARLADAVAAVLDGYSSASSSIRRTDGGSIERLDDVRFAAIDTVVTAAAGGVEGHQAFFDHIGNVILHPVLEPVVFLVVTQAVFQIATTVAVPLQDGLETFITGNFADLATRRLETMGWDHPIVTGLLMNGITSDVDMVPTFTPLMVLVFLYLTVLGDLGYMAYATVVANRVMRVIGLPGKVFIPLVVGSGCNVPAILVTRVLSSPRHHILTALLVPLTSCSARLTVYIMLDAVFFPEHAGTVVFAMYVISTLLTVLTDLVLRKTLWRTMSSEPLVIDLPTYQSPATRLVLSVT